MTILQQIRTYFLRRQFIRDHSKDLGKDYAGEFFDKVQKSKKMKRKKAKQKPIDKVTVTNLDIALRMCNIQLHRDLIDKVIDLVELIEDKGDDTSIKDICKLQSEWRAINQR